MIFPELLPLVFALLLAIYAVYGGWKHGVAGYTKVGLLVLAATLYLFVSLGTDWSWPAWPGSALLIVAMLLLIFTNLRLRKRGRAEP